MINRKTIESDLEIDKSEKLELNVLSKIKNDDSYYFNANSIRSYVHPDYPDCQVLFEKADNDINLISVVTTVHENDDRDLEFYLNSFYRSLVVKLKLSNYIFDWSPATHYKYDQEFKDIVFVMLLINRRYKFFVKDVLYMIIKMIGKDYVPYNVNKISTRYLLSDSDKNITRKLRKNKFAVTGNCVFTSSGSFKSDNNKYNKILGLLTNN